MVLDEQGVYVYRPETGAGVILRPQPDRVFVDFLCSHVKRQIWSRDLSSILVFERDETTSRLEVHQLLHGDPDIVLSAEDISLPPYPELQMDFSADGSKFVYLRNSSDSPSDLWIATENYSNPRKLTTSNPSLDKYTFGRARRISWRSIDGQELYGALLLPAGYAQGCSYPLVVSVYGGSRPSRSANSFAIDHDDGVLNKQILATRGYAVLFPDVPIDGPNPRSSLLKSVMPAIEAVVNLGVAHPDRIGIMGESYGGYSALSLLTDSARFRAAVAIASITNLFDQYNIVDDNGQSPWVGWAEHSQGHMPGSPWQYRNAYIENSPVFSADRIATPVLLFHGSNDGIPKENSRQMFSALRRLGKTAVYVEYPDSTHMPQDWPQEWQRDFMTRYISWLDGYLKMPPVPAGSCVQ